MPSAADHDQRVDRAAAGAKRARGGEREAARGGQRSVVGRDDLDRVSAAAQARGHREHLGRPDQVERLQLGEGDEDDAAGHGHRMQDAADGGKDKQRTIFCHSCAGAASAPRVRSWPRSTSADASPSSPAPGRGSGGRPRGCSRGAARRCTPPTSMPPPRTRWRRRSPPTAGARPRTRSTSAMRPPSPASRRPYTTRRARWTSSTTTRAWAMRAPSRRPRSRTGGALSR